MLAAVAESADFATATSSVVSLASEEAPAAAGVVVNWMVSGASSLPCATERKRCVVSGFKADAVLNSANSGT